MSLDERITAALQLKSASNEAHGDIEQVVRRGRSRRLQRRAVGATAMSVVMIAGVGLAVAMTRSRPDSFVTLGPVPMATSSTSSHDGLTAKLSAASPVHTGALFKLHAVFTSTSGWVTWFSINWGDGTPEVPMVSSGGPLCGPIGSASPSPPPTRTPAPPDSSSELFEHRYRQPGSYKIAVVAGHDAFCAPVAPGTVTGRFTVRVAGSPAPGNGAAEPDPEVGIHSYVGGIVSGDVRAQDTDGYVRSIDVTWPDGSHQNFINSTPCEDPVYTWPRSDLTVFRWKRPMPIGEQRMTATVTSTDCSGGAQQTFSVVRTFILTRRGLSDGGPPNIYIPHEPRSGWSEMSQGW